MGKTESGALYLSAERTSPYAFYQYWINLADADCAQRLRFLTELRTRRSKPSMPVASAQPHLQAKPKTAGRRADTRAGPRRGRPWLRARRKATRRCFFGAEIENLNRRRTDRHLCRCSERNASQRPPFAATACRWSMRLSKPAWPRARAKPAGRSPREAPTSTTAPRPMPRSSSPPPTSPAKPCWSCAAGRRGMH